LRLTWRPNSNRRLDNKLNIFEGIHKNLYFIGINLIMIGGQVLIMFLGESALSVTQLTAKQWAISLGLGAWSIPMAILIRLVPDDLVSRMIPFKTDNKVRIQISPAPEEGFTWNDAVQNVRFELAYFGGARSSRLKRVGRKALVSLKTWLGWSSGEMAAAGETSSLLHSDGELFRPRSNSAFAPAAVMAGMVAGSVALWPSASATSDEGE
jgi:P-type Ca2+ transporter type 2C